MNRNIEEALMLSHPHQEDSGIVISGSSPRQTGGGRPLSSKLRWRARDWRLASLAKWVRRDGPPHLKPHSTFLDALRFQAHDPIHSERDFLLKALRAVRQAMAVKNSVFDVTV